MRKSHLILCFITLISTTSLGQTLNERVYIKGGDDAWDNFLKEMYQYPAFKEGIVQYKNGQVFKRAMNYNKVLGTVQFIDEKRDTLAIANEEAVGLITIGDDVFVYNPYCLQSITPDGKVKIFKRQTLRVADVRQVGALGKTNTASAVESVNQVYTWMGSWQIGVNEVLLLAKVTSFYIESGDKEMIPASKKNILKLFPEKDKLIREFIKSKNIDFTKESDLLALTEYLSGL